MTSNSGLTSYLSAEEFLLKRDVRSVAQYCSDDGNDPQLAGSTPIFMVKAILIDDTTRPGSILAAKLASSSGMLESAALRSKRYSADDLASLTGNSREYMLEVLASLTMYSLICRRPGPTPPDTVVHAYEEAIKALNDLSEGIRIFAFSEAEVAGIPTTRKFTNVDYINNDLITARWTKMWGNRQISRRFF